MALKQYRDFAYGVFTRCLLHSNDIDLVVPELWGATLLPPLPDGHGRFAILSLESVVEFLLTDLVHLAPILSHIVENPHTLLTLLLFIGSLSGRGTRWRAIITATRNRRYSVLMQWHKQCAHVAYEPDMQCVPSGEPGVPCALADAPGGVPGVPGGVSGGIPYVSGGVPEGAPGGVLSDVPSGVPSVPCVPCMVDVQCHFCWMLCKVACQDTIHIYEIL